MSVEAAVEAKTSLAAPWRLLPPHRPSTAACVVPTARATAPNGGSVQGGRGPKAATRPGAAQPAAERLHHLWGGRRRRGGAHRGEPGALRAGGGPPPPPPPPTPAAASAAALRSCFRRAVLAARPRQDKTTYRKKDETPFRLLTTRREALALYREIWRVTSLFDWPDDEGRLW